MGFSLVSFAVIISEKMNGLLEKWANDMDIIGSFGKMDQGKKDGAAGRERAGIAKFCREWPGGLPEDVFPVLFGCRYFCLVGDGFLPFGG